MSEENVIELFDSAKPAVVMRGCTIEGDERVVTLLKAMAGVAAALGIEVTVEGAVVTARGLRPMPAFKDAWRANDSGETL